MNRTGLSPDGQEDDAVRWIAVRHGDDHIHIVAMLARQDRRRVRLSYERRHVRAACLAAEERYGLESTAPADRTAPRRPSRAETAEGRPPRPGRAPARHAAPRTSPPPPPGRAASRSSSPSSTAPGCWSASGSARRTPARSPGTRSPCPATPPKTAARCGTAAASSPPTSPGPSSASGGPAPAPHPVTRSPRRERNAIWEHAARAAEDAAARIRLLAGTDPAAAADAAWAASDTLHVAAAALGSRILRQAADAYDRAARAALRPHPLAHPGREPAAPRRPAHHRVRLPHQRPGAHPDRAAHPAGRARRGGRRAAPGPAARRPGRQRAPSGPAAARRRRHPRRPCSQAASPRPQPGSPGRHSVPATTPATPPGLPRTQPAPARPARPGTVPAPARRPVATTTAAITEGEHDGPIWPLPRAVRRGPQPLLPAGHAADLPGRRSRRGRHPPQSSPGRPAGRTRRSRHGACWTDKSAPPAPRPGPGGRPPTMPGGWPRPTCSRPPGPGAPPPRGPAPTPPRHRRCARARNASARCTRSRWPAMTGSAPKEPARSTRCAKPRRCSASTRTRVPRRPARRWRSKPSC